MQSYWLLEADGAHIYHWALKGSTTKDENGRNLGLYKI